MRNKWHLPASDTHFVEFGDITRYQEQVFFEALKYISNHRCAIDAGAHVGIFSRRMAKHFDRVLSFEPDLYNYECLVRNAMKFGNVQTIRGALGSLPGYGGVRVDHEPNSGARSLGRESVEVSVFTIDEFDLDMVDLIKIDTQGSEEAIIFGAKHTLKRSHPALIVEHPTNETVHFLGSLGYEAVIIVNKDVVFVEKK